MTSRRLLLLGCVAATAVTMVACGSPPATTSATGRSTAAPSATAAPAPDTLSVAVTSSGYGTLDLATIPVAVLHNLAARHGAEQTTVQFTARSAKGVPLHALASVAVNIPPGATLVVTADCTDACVGTASMTATVTVATWVEHPGIAFAGTAASFRCPRCSRGHADGEVTATLTPSAPLGDGAAVAAFAQCLDAGGAIVGGGFAHLLWPGGASTQLTISAIVNRPPATCTVSASTGW